MIGFNDVNKTDLRHTITNILHTYGESMQKKFDRQDGAEIHSVND